MTLESAQSTPVFVLPNRCMSLEERESCAISRNQYTNCHGYLQADDSNQTLARSLATHLAE